MGCLSREKLQNALYIRTLQVFEFIFLLIPHAERGKVCMKLNIAHSVKSYSPCRCFHRFSSRVHTGVVIQAAYSLCSRRTGTLKAKYVFFFLEMPFHLQSVPVHSANCV
jgi:hypothetical protein